MTKAKMKSKIQIHNTLKEYKAQIAEFDKEIDEDESIQDDAEWVNDYNNLKGWVEALSWVVGKKPPF